VIRARVGGKHRHEQISVKEIANMTVLEKFSPDLLSEAIKERFGLAEDEEVYLKAVKLGVIEDIKRKMRERTGLTIEEIEIAADLGLIRRN
jgi:hypothetical protein